MYIVLAQMRLKDGVTEEALLEASQTFQADFVSKQPGIVKRLLLRGTDGRYADLVFFANKEAADRVMEAEACSPHFARLLAIMEPPDENLPDMGVLSFEQLIAHE